jgi:hypothetical protein
MSMMAMGLATRWWEAAAIAFHTDPSITSESAHQDPHAPRKAVATSGQSHAEPHRKP